MPRQSNPVWTRDELILALSVYFKSDVTQATPAIYNEEIAQLSILLNQYNAYSSERSETFRNENGVKMKLMNFRSLDHPGHGLPNIGKQDRAIYFEFVNQKDILYSLADKIKAVIKSGINLSLTPDEDDSVHFSEGEILTRLHRYKERNPKLVQRKKASVYQKTGALLCETCSFNFETAYGELARGYIECHHIVPLSLLEPKTQTKLSALALVCANCHRMLHRRKNDGKEITIEYLKHLLSENKKKH